MPTRNNVIKNLLRLTRIMILPAVILGGLSGCLVEKKDLVTISRTTDNLRVYQPGDYITYNVSATRIPNIGGAPETLSGTLRVEWKLHADLIKPFSGGTLVPVIQEVSTLNLNGGASNQGTVRYISQDANGQMTLHAIESTSAADHYWLNSQGETTPSTIEPFTIFNSPITFGDQSFDGNPNLEFYVMEECDTGTECTSAVGRFIDNHDVVGDSTEVTTNLGVFLNPFRIHYSGSATPTPAPYPVMFDVRVLCGTEYTTHGGVMYVLPEVGMIEMSNTCTDLNINGSTVYYTISLNSTIISLPR